MMAFDRITIGRKAKELGFVRDTFEKVCRLVDVLSFIESDQLLSSSLALKGGTAINLTIFDLPRLSVDIDLDYVKEESREGMFKDRDIISDRLTKYLTSSGYEISDKSKHFHALDSFVCRYNSSGGAWDNLKIEINYMLRRHVIPLSKRSIRIPWDMHKPMILCIDPLEIFSTKMVALADRTAVRDLYDISSMIRKGIITKDNIDLYRKCVAFYCVVSSDNDLSIFQKIDYDKITPYRIWTELDPVLSRSEKFDLPDSKNKVQEFIRNELVFSDKETEFSKLFALGQYRPDILFDDPEILSRIEAHPMALWKCKTIEKNIGN